MKHTAVIFDREKNYGGKLAGYLNANSGFMFNVLAFYDEVRFRDFCLKERPELLLITEYDMDKAVDISFAETIFLSETATRTEGKSCFVYKYQSGERIEKEILGFLSASEHISRIVNRKNKMKVISVYSPYPRSDSSRKVIEHSRKLAMRNRTLYISLEPHPALEYLVDKNFSDDMTDLIYHMKSNSSNMGMILSKMTVHVGELDVLPSFRGQEDLIEIPFEDWKELLDHIEKETDYEYVVVDLSDAVRGLYGLLNASDRIITVSEDNDISHYRYLRYEESLKNAGMEDVMKKTCVHWEDMYNEPA